MRLNFIIFLFVFVLHSSYYAQIVINEGSNKNASNLLDEDGEYKDWIELYNAGEQPVNLQGFSLTDDATNPQQWTFPAYVIQPGEYLIVFCSGKNRFTSPPAVSFNTSNGFIPQTGWNNHEAQALFEWDGVSNLVLNTCSYWSGGYTSNSIFNQSTTDYVASVSSFVDGGDYACSAQYGEVSGLRPVLRINDIVVGDNDTQNCNTCYPAPYGNWYFSARMQTIYRAEDLIAAGLTAGPIDSLAFDVAYTDPTYYDYFSIQLTTTADTALSFEFINTSGSFFHTNFGIAGTGETIYLVSPDGDVLDELSIAIESLNASTGKYPDAGAINVLFEEPTPGSSNDTSDVADGYTLAPIFDLNPGFYEDTVQVSMTNPNATFSVIRYTIDGSEPTNTSQPYLGTPVSLSNNTVLKARVFAPNRIPGPAAVATYFFDVNHTTPILSISTDTSNLYGPNGMFDNPNSDWLKSGYVEYFDSTASHNLLMSQYTGMIMDGGLGGSRTYPQRSFRLKLADGIFGEAPMQHQVIPTIPYRTTYSDFYLRNGSNQYLALPYKDAAQVRMMTEGTNNYSSAWRPVSVYINGSYHGLYELREKFNSEKFEILDNADPDSMDILSMSVYYGGVLRAVEGDPQNYWDDWSAIQQLDDSAPDIVQNIGNYIDLENYTDYMIGESFMANVDWLANNIKIYRSDITDFKWRFALQDLEFSLQPNGVTDCYFNHLEWLLATAIDNPYGGAWYKLMQNPTYRLYFVNRFADLLNTSFVTDRLLEIEQYHYDLVIPEMPQYYERWGDANNVQGYMDWFNTNRSIFRDELICRGNQIRNHIQNQFEYDSQQEITLAVFPPEAGRIQINTIIPDELPWNGIYFNGAPVTVTAIPNPGYVFNYWRSENLFQSNWHNDSLILNLSIDDTLTAYFLGLPQTLKVDISEINYNDDETQPAGDWLELRNKGNATVNLTGWSLTNGVNTPRFEFPNGTLLAPNQYLVVARNLEIFQSMHPDVENVIGNFDFSLPAAGGIIRLLDHRDSILRQINYLDSLPWPLVADGGGRTLEYKINATNPSLADNWFAGCMFGSPGTAYLPCPEEIIISEINYASIPTANSGDWFEVRNIGNSTHDLSGWTVRDSEWNNSFVLPDSLLLEPDASIVVCSSTALFDAVHSSIPNRLGSMPFALSNSGELLRIYDADDKLNFSVYFQTSNTWPTSPNGEGYTLEWNAEATDINSSEGWFAGCLLGSPGEVFTECFTSEVLNLTSSTGFLIYPNPASTELNLLLRENVPATISIYNSHGSLVHREKIASTFAHRVATQTWQSGVYVLHIQQNNQQWTERFILSN